MEGPTVMTMITDHLFFLLQLAGGTFPTGGFSQSWGLETFVTDGRVAGASDCRKFIAGYLDAVVGSCEGPILREAVGYAANWDAAALAELEELSLAMKLSKESRDSALKSGKALMRIASEIIEDSELPGFYGGYSRSGITNAVAFGTICGRSGICPERALEAYVFSVVNGIVQSAVKLIPLGNTEAQRMLLEVRPDMAGCVRKSSTLAVSDISNFSPGFDLASILHETLPMRLYMS